MKNACKMIVVKPEGKRLQGRCRIRTENRIKMYMKEI
jgi:hypothetical protein